MALVFPLHFHKPFASAVRSRQKPNSADFFLPDSDQFHRSILSTTTSIQLPRHRSFTVNGLKNRDSEPSNSSDDETSNLGVKAALSMLRFYKREISPLMPNSCRYVPTCSEYSMIAYKKYGVAKGTILTAWRLCRCNPLGGLGFDPPRWFDETSNPEE